MCGARVHLVGVGSGKRRKLRWFRETDAVVAEQGGGRRLLRAEAPQRRKGLDDLLITCASSHLPFSDLTIHPLVYLKSQHYPRPQSPSGLMPEAFPRTETYLWWSVCLKSPPYSSLLGSLKLFLLQGSVHTLHPTLSMSGIKYPSHPSLHSTFKIMCLFRKFIPSI